MPGASGGFERMPGTRCSRRRPGSRSRTRRARQDRRGGRESEPCAQRWGDTASGSRTGEPSVTSAATACGCRAARTRASVPPRLCPTTIAAKPYRSSPRRNALTRLTPLLITTSPLIGVKRAHAHARGYPPPPLLAEASSPFRWGSVVVRRCWTGCCLAAVSRAPATTWPAPFDFTRPLALPGASPRWPSARPLPRAPWPRPRSRALLLFSLPCPRCSAALSCPCARLAANGLIGDRVVG